jgi:HK97 family phage prohead protease
MTEDRRVIYRAVDADYEVRRDGFGSGNGRTLAGRFAVFNRWTEIDSAVEGHFMEMIQPGAFSKTIRESGRRVQVLFSHGQDPQIGLQSLGKIRSLEENAAGVDYEVELFRGLPELLLQGLEAGAYGASFRAKPIKTRDDPYPTPSDRNPKRLPESVISELRLREFGPCPLPAYAETTAGLRSVSDDYTPLVVRKRAIVPAESKQESPPPYWQLQRPDEEPRWKLRGRKDERYALRREGI